MEKKTNLRKFEYSSQSHTEESPKTPKGDSQIFLPCDTKSDHDHYHENNRSKRKTEQNSQQFIPTQILIMKWLMMLL